MRKFLIALLLAMPISGRTALVGHFLAPQTASDYIPDPLLLRELHDGQWLAGVKKDIWVLEDNRDGHQWLQIGGYSAWDTLKGDQSWGLTIGTQMKIFQGTMAGVARALQLGYIPGETELQYIDKALTFQVFGGYRPVNNGTEVIGPWVYGYGFVLSIPVTLDMVGWFNKPQN